VTIFGPADRPSGGSLARFRHTPSVEPLPRQIAALAADHPAVVEGRTVYPSRVFRPSERDRVLIGGENNSKLGKLILKGPWAGCRIFHLALEERATCPRSCAVWRECYGNGMPLAVRFRYGPELIEWLDAELRELAAAHPDGIAVRLHSLGDFPDTGYVARWARWLREILPLHVWGYTAYPAGSEIGRAIAHLNAVQRRRWRVRFSVAPGAVPDAMEATVAWQKPAGTHAEGGVVCPVETGRARTCGTCCLCWAPGAGRTRITFLGHGRKITGPSAAPSSAAAPAAPVVLSDDPAVTAAILAGRVVRLPAHVRGRVKLNPAREPLAPAGWRQ